MLFPLKLIQRISFSLRGKVGMGVELERFHSVTHSKSDRFKERERKTPLASSADLFIP